MATQTIEISRATIIFTATFLLSLWFLYQVRSILVLLFIAFILMTAVNPLVKLAKRFRVPAILVMFVVYFGAIILLSSIIATLAPVVVGQTRGITAVVPTYMHNLENIFNTRFDTSITDSYLNSIPSNLLKIAAGAFSNIMNILALFFIAYYLVVERPHLHKYLKHFYKDQSGEARAEALIDAIEHNVGGWVRGEIALMLIIGVMTYIGLIALGIPYALPLAVLAGLLEAVPNLGPTISAIPVILMGLTISPIIGLGGLLLSILIQQIENNLIVPKIMQATTGTQPLVTFVALLLGFTLGGVAGAVLAMPIFLTGRTIIKTLNPSLGGRS